ncbi:MAG TPA: GntR family transcriptional regulator [Bacillota bacterium]
MPLSDYNVTYMSLSEQIFKIFKEQIVNGELSPGERLVIDRFARQLGVSSTPVRDALRLLISAGFAEKKSNDSIFVIKLSRADIVELFDMREVLEGLSVRLLTQKIHHQQIDASVFRNLLQEFKEKEREFLVGHNETPHEFGLQFHDLVHKLCPNKRLKKQIELIMNQTYRVRKVQYKNKYSEYLKNKRQNRLLQETQEHIEIIEKMLSGEAEKAENLIREHIRKAKEEILSLKNLSE